MHRLGWVMALVLLPSGQACSLAAGSFQQAVWQDDDALVTDFGFDHAAFDITDGTVHDWPDAIFSDLSRDAQGAVVLRSNQEGLGGDCSGLRFVELMDPQGRQIRRWDHATTPFVSIHGLGFVHDGRLVMVDAQGGEVAIRTAPTMERTHEWSAAVAGDETVWWSWGGELVVTNAAGNASLPGAGFGAFEGARQTVAEGDRIALVHARDELARVWILDPAGWNITHVIDLPINVGWPTQAAWFQGGVVVHSDQEIVWTSPERSVAFGTSGPMVSTFPPAIPPDLAEEDEHVLAGFAVSPAGDRLALLASQEGYPHSITLLRADLSIEGRWVIDAQGPLGQPAWSWEAGTGVHVGGLDVSWRMMDVPVPVPGHGGAGQEVPFPWASILLLAAAAARRRMLA